MFWYEDVLLNESLTPAIASVWRYDDEVVTLEVLDDYTVRFNFPGPKPFFREALVHTAWGMFRPKHYLKDFHPAYVEEETLQRQVREAGFEHWFELFASRSATVAHAPMYTDLPTLSSYVLVEKASTQRVYERNPFYWKVDSAGNQLPYIDRISAEILADREIFNGRIIAGELDFAGFETDIRNFPLYRRYEEPGNFRTLLWRSGHGNELIYQLNLTHNDEVLREVFQDVRFRRALSLAINRDEIGEEIYFGRAEPAQYTMLPISRYYKPEYAQAYTEYDPEAARALLDEMGLEVGSDGYRLRPDGGRLSITIENYDSEVPRVPNVELVMEYWRDIGIDVSMRPISGELQTERAPANLMDATTWPGGSANDTSFPADPAYLLPTFPRWSVIVFTEWARWFQTDGASGFEPPEQIKELEGWWDELMVSPSQERIDALADNILASQAENLWVIGTVSNAPYPIIARNTLHNVPEEGYWGWPFLWSSSWDPEQFFFRD
jgi:peptide/nickel transport system substrate-binding protein